MRPSPGRGTVLLVLATITSYLMVSSLGRNQTLRLVLVLVYAPFEAPRDVAGPFDCPSGYERHELW